MYRPAIVSIRGDSARSAFVATASHPDSSKCWPQRHDRRRCAAESFQAHHCVPSAVRLQAGWGEKDPIARRTDQPTSTACETTGIGAALSTATYTNASTKPSHSTTIFSATVCIVKSLIRSLDLDRLHRMHIDYAFGLTIPKFSQSLKFVFFLLNINKYSVSILFVCVHYIFKIIRCT